MCTGGTHRLSASPTSQRVSSDSTEVLVDLDVTEGAGVPEYRGVARLNLSGTGCGIHFQPASHSLMPYRFRMRSESGGVKDRREEFLVLWPGVSPLEDCSAGLNTPSLGVSSVLFTTSLASFLSSGFCCVLSYNGVRMSFCWKGRGL